jgi:hypothetical protein
MVKEKPQNSTQIVDLPLKVYMLLNPLGQSSTVLFSLRRRHMYLLRRLLLCLTVLAVSGCAASKKAEMPQTLSNVSVRTSYSPTVKFSAGSKYAFVNFASDSDLGTEAALIGQRVQTALTNELKKKGYKPSEYTDISFFVAYTGRIQQQINILAAKSKIQGNDWISAVVVPNDYVSGALLVQIIDAKSMEPVWLGVFNADIMLSFVSEQEKKERVGYAVHELLKTFPPK